MRQRVQKPDVLGEIPFRVLASLDDRARLVLSKQCFASLDLVRCVGFLNRYQATDFGTVGDKYYGLGSGIANAISVTRAEYPPGKNANRHR
jgi:hypothetical protein